MPEDRDVIEALEDQFTGRRWVRVLAWALSLAFGVACWAVVLWPLMT